MKNVKLFSIVAILTLTSSLGFTKGGTQVDSASSQSLNSSQTKYICESLKAENALEFVLSYESQVMLQSVVITRLNSRDTKIEAHEPLASGRYISPETEVINFKFDRDEATENLVILESIKESVVAPDGEFSKFNANIKLLDGKFMMYSCKESYLVR